MAKRSCAQNDFYDGLLEKCKPCYLRCSKSPPDSCTAYCTSDKTVSPVPENHNVWLILVFLLLSAVTAVVLLLQVLRKKRRRHFLKNKGTSQEHIEDSGNQRDSRALRQTDVAHDGPVTSEKFEHNYENSSTHCNSSLPLPSTEEGTTILVTTKTAQTYNYATYCTQDKTLDLWRSVSVV
ncbi:tumor necrosis factor receptor superfamily member 17 [Megalops cyprinoides]|uniref:tumor necrosis factor receptor superfamily member 17 n=1 Tax=Megalops cyprinoides TaxID=118141 RepID=UPI0018648172|nr:tumor necrosis factor receptor superfamily member 17 [Megalops cyprinoides]